MDTIIEFTTIVHQCIHDISKTYEQLEEIRI